jgi:hypothetical protein
MNVFEWHSLNLMLNVWVYLRETNLVWAKGRVHSNFGRRGV